MATFDSYSRPRPGIRIGIWLCCCALAQAAVMDLAFASDDGGSSANSDAQTASQPTIRLEEVVVTAQKRKEPLQKVPISMTVLGGPQLDVATYQGVSDILNTVPGVTTLQTYAGGGTMVMIRGVSAGEALLNGAGTVAYYIDSVPFGLVKEAISPDMDAYDLQRIEVLRGPQGTLYGANALDGVVRVLTNDANLEKFEIKGRATGSDSDGGGGNYRADMAVNVPLIDDKLAVRAVVGYQNEGGWINTSFKRGFNDARLRNLRLKVNAQPTDALSVALSVWNSRDDYGGPSVGDTPRFNSAAFTEPIHNGYTATGAKVAYQADAFSVTSETSYLDYSTDSIFDATPFLGARSDEVSDLGSRVASEEVRMVSSDEGDWHWLIGGMYRKATESLAQSLPQFAFGLSYVDVSRSDAVYGELTRMLFGGEVALTGGFRYFHDDISQDDQTGTNAPVIPAGSTAAATTPRAVVTWYPRRNLTVYASYSEGFRSGFPQNAPAAVLAPTEPDLLKNYEVGAKGTFLGGRLVSDLSVYYMDWEHVQESVTVTVNGLPFSGTINGQSASGQGVDLDVTGAPFDRLTVGGSVSWNNLHMDENVYSGGALLFPAGGRLNLSAEYTASSTVAYSFPLGGGLRGDLSIEGHYVSSLDNSVLLGATVLTGVGNRLFTSRARFTVASDSNWTAALFVDNLNNYQESPVPGYGTLTQYMGRIRPRTVGLQLSYQY